jgi:hypothetical protein
MRIRNEDADDAFNLLRHGRPQSDAADRPATLRSVPQSMRTSGTRRPRTRRACLPNHLQREFIDGRHRRQLLLQLSIESVRSASVAAGADSDGSRFMLLFTES